MLKSLNGRFIIWGGVIVYIFLSCTPIAKKSFNYSSELEALSRLDLLPEFRSNCIVEQISSYDKTGGNDDGLSSIEYGLPPLLMILWSFILTEKKMPV